MKLRRNISCVYTGPVGAKMRPPGKRRQPKVKRYRVALIGGPLAGCVANLEFRGDYSTLPIRMQVGPLVYEGRYVNGAWEGTDPLRV